MQLLRAASWRLSSQRLLRDFDREPRCSHLPATSKSVGLSLANPPAPSNEAGTPKDGGARR